MPDIQTSRRRLLQGVTAGSAGLLFSGSATAGGSPPARIVGTASRSAERAAKRRAESVNRVLDFGEIGKAVAGRFSDKAVERLRRRDDVRYVEADSTYHAIAQTTPWGIDRVDADVAHGDGYTGNGADIAIIDTGIDDDHPDLQANVGKGKAYVKCGSSGGCRFGAQPNDNQCNENWSDDNDHGTHCAGIADAVNNSEDVIGVSTEATLHAVKVLDGCGSGSLSDVAAGIEYVADQGWDVGSLSLGASSGDQTLKDACQYAYDNGVLLVAAAGNDGPCTDCVGYPAAYSTVIAVSSTASDDSLSDFSSTGPEVEIAAPGSSILSTVPPESSSDGTDTFSGTSMACPHVSGAGGILMANGYTNTEARDQLNSTAEDIGLGSNEQGSGLLDVEAAVGGSSSTDSAPSVSWVTPTDGETVSGTVTVQIDASDSEDSDDSLDVTYSVDGGTSRSTTYNSTSGYYEDSWDSSGVSDGEHTLQANATDSAGNTSTSSITVTTDNATGGDTAPAIDSFDVSSRSTGPWFRVTADWAVSDADGDLETVTTELLDADGNVLASASSDVGGSSASGSHEVRTRNSARGVRLTVTDANGNDTSSTKSV
jgi:subtilisin